MPLSAVSIPVKTHQDLLRECKEYGVGLPDLVRAKLSVPLKKMPRVAYAAVVIRGYSDDLSAFSNWLQHDVGWKKTSAQSAASQIRIALEHYPEREADLWAWAMEFADDFNRIKQRRSLLRKWLAFCQLNGRSCTSPPTPRITPPPVPEKWTPLMRERLDVDGDSSGGDDDGV